jgi:L-fucose isomerase-like protein
LKKRQVETVHLISNGDFRDTVGVACWPKQEETLRAVEQAFGELGVRTVRAHGFKDREEHGFITTQAEGCRIFADLNKTAAVAVVMSSWVWANHIASSLKLHRGPILLIGNFDGTWPGLVSLLNHSAVLDRLGIEHAKVWSSEFRNDDKFMGSLETWLERGLIEYSEEHISDAKSLSLSDEAVRAGKAVAGDILRRKRILGQMDPGCMGMLNAVMSPDTLAAVGMPLELLNQSDLLAEMALVPERRAAEHLRWLEEKGTHFHWSDEPESGLTRQQVLEQMKMYHAAGVLYRRYGLSAIGIPYQYGLVRCTSASDLAEGMLNNCERPAIKDPDTGEVIEHGAPIVHFNEGDVGSAVPQVLMKEILSRKGMAPETTLHDVRWGDWWAGDFVWALEISGGGPPAHWNGWENTHVYRQPVEYFPKGGGTCSGVSRPGTITWARFYERYGAVGMDCGTGEVVSLPDEEVRRRLEATTREWPIANVLIPGYSRDQLMSTHRSNHLTMCYGDILQELIAAATNLGIPVQVVGDAREQLT